MRFERTEALPWGALVHGFAFTQARTGRQNQVLTPTLLQNKVTDKAF